MKITVSRRASRAQLTLAAAAALIAAGALAAQSAAGAAAPKGPTHDVTVRVEGLTSTLLPPTTVTLTASSVTKDGNAVDSCSGLSALGALQDATKGSWGGSWSKSYREYLITAIDGVAYPLSASYYWAFWVDNKPAAVGACAYDPTPGTTLLFFPDYDGKSKSVVAPNVLGLSAPAQALVGKPFSVLVTSYANTNGKPSPATGASVTAGGAHATTSSAGKATLQVATPGMVEIKATAPNTVRDETTICVHKPGAGCVRARPR